MGDDRMLSCAENRNAKEVEMAELTGDVEAERAVYLEQMRETVRLIGRCASSPRENGELPNRAQRVTPQQKAMI